MPVAWDVRPLKGCGLSGWALGLVACWALSVSTVAAATSLPLLPGGATPGGAHPQAGGLPEVLKAAPPPFPIPPVLQRPLGVNQGPRLVVHAFRLEGVHEHPDVGITRKALKALITNSLARHPKGYTIGQMQLLANRITRFYRARGYILARAFVPVQTVRQGIVVLRVIEGILDRVVPEGNRMYSNHRMKWPFEDQVGHPVRKSAIDTALLRLSDYPGLTAYGVFRPGPKVGTTELVLKALQEQRFDAGISADNYGTQYTGQERVHGYVAINNPTGIGDQLTLSALRTFNPDNGNYGSVSYVRPLMIPSLLIGGSVSRDSFLVGQQLALLNIVGEADIARIYLREAFVRSILFNFNAQLSFTRERGVTRQHDAILSQDDLSVVRATLSFNNIDTRFNGIDQGSLTYSQGLPGVMGAMSSQGDALSSRIGGDGQRVGGSFNKVNLSLSRLQHLTNQQSLLLQVNGQYSGDLLSSLEQMALGGPDSVRAYPVAEYLMDKGVFASAQWNINAPGFANVHAFEGMTWGQILQLSAFYDVAAGRINDPLLGETQSVTLRGAGVGVQLSIPGQLLANLSVARHLGGENPSNGRSPQYWFNLSYEF
ncbi:MAG: hypothetical protein M0Z84_05460 [Gammaproteobacteria bacterium]|nr:hypothetical protein [Gammaproteobacteria bacterium]